ncbi:1895_t:CDS:1, partial [Gigaspora margarita]
INPNKTELMVMCSKKRKNREELCVLMGDPEIKVFAKNQKETTCFLEVWVSLRKQQKANIARAKKKVNHAV